MPADFLKHFSKENSLRFLKRRVPLTGWALNYRLADLRYDIIAGITVGLTLVPQCMAYAQMADVRPQHGLYGGFLAQFMYVLFGTSKDASVGPSAIVSMMLGQVNVVSNPLATIGDNTYLCILSMSSGLILMLMGVLKLGFIVNLFSIPVISGFTTASGFSIFASQLKTFFGLKEAPNDTPAVFVKQIKNVFDRSNEIKTYDVAFGVSTICFLLFLQYLPLIVEKILVSMNRRRNDRSNDDDDEDEDGKLTARQQTFMEWLRLITATRNVMAFVLTTLAAYLLIQADSGVSPRLLTVTGLIEPGFPVPEFPSFQVSNETHVLKTANEIFSELSVAFIITPMMILLEMFAITKSLGRKNGYRIDATNELFAVGLGNFLQSFLQAIPVTIAVSRTALNDQCKGKTLVAAVVSATFVILSIAFLTETFFYIPKSSLAGIIMVAAYNLIDFSIFRPMAKEYWRDLIILVLTFVLCLFFDMAYGILICLFVNMITFLRPVVRMQMYVTRGTSGDGEHGRPVRTTVVQLSHGMKYPSADKFLDRMARILAKSGKHVVLDCRFFTGVDYTGLQALRGILLMAYQMNKHIIFANMAERVQKKVEKIGLDHWSYVDTVTDAVKAYNTEEEEVAARQSAAPATSGGGTTSDGAGLGVRPPGISRMISFTTSPSSHDVLHLTPRTSAERIRNVEPAQRPRMIETQRSVDDAYSKRSSRSESQPTAPVLRRHSISTAKKEATVTKSHSGGEDDPELLEKRNKSFLRNLSRPAYFYLNVPIFTATVGHAPVQGVDSSDGELVDEQDGGGGGGNEDDQESSIGDPLDLLTREQGLADAQQLSSPGDVDVIELHDMSQQPSTSTRQSEQYIQGRHAPLPHSLLSVPRVHEKLGARFSRISEVSETFFSNANDDNDDADEDEEKQKYQTHYSQEHKSQQPPMESVSEDVHENQGFDSSDPQLDRRDSSANSKKSF